uniref:CSON010490 protein n=1 Tax=Culicoides sonorensis TaxID=179676 RepID=A0A336LIH2_CULSO
MTDDTNIFAITNHFLEAIFNTLLSQVISPFFAGFAECLFLACIPDVGSEKWKILLEHSNSYSLIPFSCRNDDGILRTNVVPILKQEHVVHEEFQCNQRHQQQQLETALVRYPGRSASRTM